MQQVEIWQPLNDVNTVTVVILTAIIIIHTFMFLTQIPWPELLSKY